MAVSAASVRIDPARDQLLDDFSKQTLKERYLFGEEKTPQEAYARASAAFADDEAHAQRLYEYSSKGWLSYATPLLSNGGTTRGLPISCFLTSVEDSREAISAHYDEVIWLSSTGGGVGAYWGDLRSNGEKTARGSQSTGIVPFMCVDDRLILAVSQGGTRRGSLAVYINIDHPEIEEFITIRKPAGDLNRKATNLHNAIGVTDEFMRCLRTNEPFALRSPKTGETIRTINARETWKLILETRKQTGEPYLFFVDTANKGLPATQKAKGLKVKQSNLCVAPDTELLTRAGYLPIGGLEDTTVDVWNGQDFSPVVVRRTAENAELVRVWFEDGAYLDCTPEHKFYLADGSMVRAAELADGQQLEAPRHPVIEPSGAPVVDRDAAYTAGWATISGFEDESRLTVFVASEQSDESKRRLASASKNVRAEDHGLMISYEPGAIDAGHVPRWTVKSRLAWLGGVLDAAGEWISLEGVDYLSFCTPDASLVQEMRLMALECGLIPRIRITDTAAGFMLPAPMVASLVQEGHVVNTTTEGRSTMFPAELVAPQVADVHTLPARSATFCFTEEQRHRGVFNGVLTGQCTEITLATGRDNDGKKRTAVCCLSSVNAEKWDEWKDDPRFIEDMFRALDNCLQVFIDDAPEGLRDAVYSAAMERSVGAGLLGFHYLLQSKNLAFESEEARALNVEIFAHYRAQADAASLKLGAERGEAPDMIGTGHRFAHRMAVAPNASTSILLNTSPSIEPIRANVFLHKTLSGSFRVRNKFLEPILESLGLNTSEVWKSINAEEGSIQHLTPEVLLAEYGVTVEPTAWAHTLKVYRTAMEIKQDWVVIHAVDRQPFIDQAQSVNLFFRKDAQADYLSRVHFKAWEGGLKSLYYLRSETEARAENVNTKVERKVTVNSDATDAADAAEASAAQAKAAIVQDDGCIMCEG